jgi:hypothetical protein
MSLIKKILVVLVIAIIGIQFLRPSPNERSLVKTSDISMVVRVPDTVMILLKNACYDCHSYYTNYPWYSNIQPIGWLISSHIQKAKNELNFSEFGNYSQRRQVSKLEGMANSIKDDIMPLKAYKLMHKTAQLSTIEKSVLINWVNQSIDSVQIKY